MFKKTKAFSLLEIILAVALFTIFGAVLLRAMVGVPFDFSNSADRMKAQYLLEEGQEAVTAIRNYDWDEVTVGGPFGLDNSSGYWDLAGSSDTVGGFTRTVTITEVNASKYDVAITVTWTTDETIAQSSTTNFRVTNWEALSFIIDSVTNFTAGYLNGVEVVSPGSIQLSNVGSYAASSTFITKDYSGTGDPTQFHLEANKLYASVTNNSAGEFFLYDVKDVSRGTVTEVDSTEIGGSATDFVISGDYAYIASSHDNEVQVVRLSDMTVVETVNLTETHDATGIDIDGTDLVVVRDATVDAATAGEIYRLNASNPLALSVASYATLEYGFNDVQVYNGYAFVVSGVNTKELEVYRLSDMTQVNVYDLSGNDDVNVIELSADGQTAYLGRSQSGSQPELMVFDISSPETTFTAGDVLGTVEVGESINDIEVVGTEAFLALDDLSKELGVADLSTYTLSYTLDLDQSSPGEAVTAFGAHIYGGVSHDTETIQVLQTNSGGWVSPSIVDSADLSGNQNMFDIVVDGDYAYLGRDSGGSCNSGTGTGCEFVVYDISTPTAIVYLGGVEIGADVNDIYISGNYAYLANDGTELQVVDITIKNSPSIVGSYDSDSNANGESVWGSGTYVYLGTANNNKVCNSSNGKNCEFYILDVSTPSSPSYVSGVEIGTLVQDIEVNGVFAYIATPDNSAEIRSIDLSSHASPGAPVSYNHSGTGNPQGMTFDSSTNTLHVALASNGGQPDYSILYFGSGGATPSAQYGLAYNETHNMVAVAGDYAFLVGDAANAEIKIIDVSDITSPTEVSRLALSSNGNGVATDGTYAFIASENNSQEIQVVGPGAASSTLNKEGMYVSEFFDSAVTSPSWGNLEWVSSGTGTVQFQIRTASSTGGLDYAEWVGPSGSASAYFTTSDTLITPYSGASGRRYIQVAAFLSGNGSSTPVVEQIIINYTP